MSRAGAANRARRWSAARTRSSMLEENEVLAYSPCDDPSPVKSKRRTAMPSAASLAAMWRAAMMSFEQVKQCANNA